jgi:hypothetical protein
MKFSLGTILLLVLLCALTVQSLRLAYMCLVLEAELYITTTKLHSSEQAFEPPNELQLVKIYQAALAADSPIDLIDRATSEQTESDLSGQEHEK